MQRRRGDRGPHGADPLVAEFDGDRRSDVLWYGPGGQADHLWLGRPDWAFVGSPATVGDSYLPLVGDFNGNGRADVLWFGSGPAGSRARTRHLRAPPR